MVSLPARLSTVISLHSGMSRAVHPQEFLKMDVDHWHIPVWASVSFRSSPFVTCSLNLWAWWHVWSDCRFLMQSSGGHCKATGWDHKKAAPSSWMVVVPCLRVKPHLTGLWWLSYQCTLRGLAVRCFPEWEAWSLTVLPTGHFWQAHSCFSGYWRLKHAEGEPDLRTL